MVACASSSGGSASRAPIASVSAGTRSGVLRSVRPRLGVGFGRRFLSREDRCVGPYRSLPCGRNSGHGTAIVQHAKMLDAIRDGGSDDLRQAIRIDVVPVDAEPAHEYREHAEIIVLHSFDCGMEDVLDGFVVRFGGELRPIPAIADVSSPRLGWIATRWRAYVPWPSSSCARSSSMARVRAGPGSRLALRSKDGRPSSSSVGASAMQSERSRPRSRSAKSFARRECFASQALELNRFDREHDDESLVPSEWGIAAAGASGRCSATRRRGDRRASASRRRTCGCFLDLRRELGTSTSQSRVVRETTPSRFKAVPPMTTASRRRPRAAMNASKRSIISSGFIVSSYMIPTSPRPYALSAGRRAHGFRVPAILREDGQDLARPD